jgi:hypothetical protein
MVVALALGCHAQDYEDFFPAALPKTPTELKDKLEDIKNLSDVPASEPIIIYQELSKARASMRALQARAVVKDSDFDQKKSDFRDSIALLKGLATDCSPKNSADVHAHLGDVYGENPLVMAEYQSTDKELRKLSVTPEQELCKKIKAGELPILKIHDDEVEKSRSLAHEQAAYAEQLALAYSERYHKLQGMASRSSEQFWQRITSLVVIFAAIGFALLIFVGVRHLGEHDLKMELIESGQLIQFPTVMILLVVVTVLGLSAILDDKTLGTLLGGIAGYVLSQGVGRAASREALKAYSTGQRAGGGGNTDDKN